MKAFSTLIILITLIGRLHAQSISEVNNEKVIKYFNGFQHTKNDPAKMHLALSYAQRLAREHRPSLQNLLHNHYAQALSKLIIGNDKNTTQRKLLDLFVTDTSQVLAEVIKPIAVWVAVQENENNPEALRTLTRNFMTTELSEGDIYPNRIGRYALLIYQLIDKKSGCEQVADSLLDQTLLTLKRALGIHNTHLNATRDAKRAGLRYLYAYSNLLKAQEVRKEGDTQKARLFYQTSAEYSPDLLDQNSKDGYFYDMVFLTGRENKDDFKQEYLEFLTSDPKNPEALQNLTALAITDPVHLSGLKAFYGQHYSNQEPFEKYWEKALQQTLNPAPHFTLLQLNNASFSLKAHKGKWVLLDFWGTWCNPCLKEMPQLQSFYREILINHADKILLLAIACKDTEPKVRTYLNKNRYNFPVAMSNSAIEKEYAISAYPTKILITPQGKQLIIPSDENWIQKVKLFCEL